ncbi:copper homeostasis protein CutC [Flagellimonas lutimaris]|uniref:PF03932 family protein CutC n=1 Tax=Flagellimonas lutimaris TaxID=475082 RepID=A0A3A1N903_9FLAO|nr:copper homeostasis protein CutC [Allomuricauda lutimaris]RIV35403.1 copper homeostasis protein CutC [Allomuricauda lutimaris]|tara:strand:+ start:13 stop:732 length:720 start_codon:yes stop_codon:yes gene_type:complete
MLVEVCANSLESALNAEKAGADRIELCSELGVGGVTPSVGLITLVKKELNIPVHVLIRPRGGHFTYSDAEFEVMKADILACKELGVEGIVSGILMDDFSVDMERTQALVDLAKPMHFTFHRAFDWVAEPLEAIKQLEDLGVQTILTSGGETSAEKGVNHLDAWQKQTSLTIMAGGGVSPKNASKFKDIGLRAIHCSGTSFGNRLNLEGKISMNSTKHLVEDEVAVSSVDTLASIVEAVK